MTAELARAAADAGLQSVSVSIDGNEATHDSLRGVARGIPVCARGGRSPERCGRRPRRQHADQPTVDARAARGPGDADRPRRRAWRIQLTVAMGRAADDPEMLLQPDDLLELLPAAGDSSKERCDERA